MPRRHLSPLALGAALLLSCALCAQAQTANYEARNGGGSLLIPYLEYRPAAGEGQAWWLRLEQAAGSQDWQIGTFGSTPWCPAWPIRGQLIPPANAGTAPAWQLQLPEVALPGSSSRYSATLASTDLSHFSLLNAGARPTSVNSNNGSSCPLPSCTPAPALQHFDFENGLQGWQSTDPSAALSLSNTAQSGRQALQASGRKQAYYGPGVTLSGLQAGVGYTVSGWLRSTSAVGHSITLRIGSGSSAVYRKLTGITPQANQWTRFAGQLYLRPSEVAQPLLLYVNTASGTAPILLDSVSILPPPGCPALSAGQTDMVRVAQGQLVSGAQATPLRLRGINLVAYDDEDSPVDDFLTQTWWAYDRQDFANIRNLGFNAIRLALWWRLFMADDGAATPTWRENGFAWLDSQLGWARAEGLRVILDLHAPPGGGFQGPGSAAAFWSQPVERKRFIALWQELARRYRHDPTIAAYDLINEPNPPQQSNYLQLLTDTIGAIRAIDPDHLLQIENCFAADCTPFVIDGVSNVLYDFHFYDPWNEYTGHSSNSWPSSSGNRNSAWLRNAFHSYSDFYRQRGLPFMVSEFGQRRDHFSRGASAWLDSVWDLLDEEGASYCYFSYKGNPFGLYDNVSRLADSAAENAALSTLLRRRQGVPTTP